MARKKWKPTKAYNIIALRPSVTVDLHDGQILCMSPHTWRTPATEKEEAFWENKLAHSNPPHYVVTTCPAKWNKERGIYEPIPPEVDTTDYDREALDLEEQAEEGKHGTAGGGA